MSGAAGARLSLEHLFTQRTSSRQDKYPIKCSDIRELEPLKPHVPYYQIVVSIFFSIIPIEPQYIRSSSTGHLLAEAECSAAGTQRQRKAEIRKTMTSVFHYFEPVWQRDCHHADLHLPYLLLQVVECYFFAKS